MEVVKKKGNKFWITNRTPGCRDFPAKVRKLELELKAFIKDNPKYRLLLKEKQNEE